MGVHVKPTGDIRDMYSSKFSHEDHKKRHEKLHEMLDELFADYINHNRRKRHFLDTPIIDLICWSAEQKDNPTPDDEDF